MPRSLSETLAGKVKPPDCEPTSSQSKQPPVVHSLPGEVVRDRRYVVTLVSTKVLGFIADMTVIQGGERAFYRGGKLVGTVSVANMSHMTVEELK